MIGINIKVRREQKGWTQMHLAEAAALTERTVQRAERGDVGKESLISIASALDSSVEELRFDPFGFLASAFGVPRDELTPELVEKKSKEFEEKRAAEERKFNEKYLKVPLTRVTASSQFQIAVGAFAVQSSAQCELPEEAQDVFAERQFMMDYVDCVDLTDAIAAREMDKYGFEVAKRLEAMGYAVCVGCIKERMRFRDGKFGTWPVAYLLVCPVHEVREFAAVERDRDADI
jgi:transcriptional regulator with XRE-family HTH domain